MASAAAAAAARRLGVGTKTNDPNKKLEKFFDDKQKPSKKFSAAAWYLDHCSRIDGGRFCRDHYSRLWQTVLDMVQAHDATYKTLKERSGTKASKEIISLFQVLQKMLLYLPDLIQKRWQLRSITSVLERGLYVQNRPEVRKVALHCCLQLLEDLHELDSPSISFHLDLLTAALDLHAFKVPGTQLEKVELQVPPLYGSDANSVFVPLLNEKNTDTMPVGKTETFSTFGGATAIGEVQAPPPPLALGSRERIRYSLMLLEELFVFIESQSQERFSAWWRFVLRDRVLKQLFPRAIIDSETPPTETPPSPAPTAKSADGIELDASAAQAATAMPPNTPVVPTAAGVDAPMLYRKPYTVKAGQGFTEGCPAVVMPIVMRKLSSWWRQWFGRSSQVLWADPQTCMLLLEFATQSLELPAGISVTHVSMIAFDSKDAVKTLRRTDSSTRTAADDTIAMLSGTGQATIDMSRRDKEQVDVHIAASVGEHGSASASGNIMSHVPGIGDGASSGAGTGKHSALIEALHSFTVQFFGDNVASHASTRSGLNHDANYLSTVADLTGTSASPAATALVQATDGLAAKSGITLDVLQRFLLQLMPRVFCCGDKEDGSYMTALFGKQAKGEGSEDDQKIGREQRISACQYALRLCIAVASSEASKIRGLRQQFGAALPADFSAVSPVMQELFDMFLTLLMSVLNGRPLLPPKQSVNPLSQNGSDNSESPVQSSETGGFTFGHPTPPSKPMTVPAWLANVVAKDVVGAALTIWMICAPPRAEALSDSSAGTDNWMRLSRAWSHLFRRKEPTIQLSVMLKQVLKDLTQACAKNDPGIARIRSTFDNLMLLLKDGNTIDLYLPLPTPNAQLVSNDPGEQHAAVVACVTDVVNIVLSHSNVARGEDVPEVKNTNREWKCDCCERCGVVDVLRITGAWLLQACRLAQRSSQGVKLIPNSQKTEARCEVFERGISSAYSCISRVILEELRIRGGRYPHHDTRKQNSYFSYIPQPLLYGFYDATACLLAGVSLDKLDDVANIDQNIGQTSSMCLHSVFRHGTQLFSYGLPGATALAATVSKVCQRVLVPERATATLAPLDVRSAAVRMVCSLIGYAAVLQDDPLFLTIHWDLLDTLIATLQHYISAHPVGSAVQNAAQGAHERTGEEYSSGFEQGFQRTGQRPQRASYGKMDVGEKHALAIAKALDASHYAASEAAALQNASDLSEHHVARMCVHGITTWLIIHENLYVSDAALPPPGENAAVIETALTALLRTSVCFSIHPIWHKVSLAAFSGLSNLVHSLYSVGMTEPDGNLSLYGRNSGVIVQSLVCVSNAIAMHMHSQSNRPARLETASEDPLSTVEHTPAELCLVEGINCVKNWMLLSPPVGIEANGSRVFESFYLLCLRAIWYRRLSPNATASQLAPNDAINGDAQWQTRKQTAQAPAPRTNATVLAGARHRAMTATIEAGGVAPSDSPRPAASSSAAESTVGFDLDDELDSFVSPYAVQKPYGFVGEESVAMTGFHTYCAILDTYRDDHRVAFSVHSDELNVPSIRISVGPSNVDTIKCPNAASTSVEVSSRDVVDQFTWNWSMLTAKHESDDLLLLKMLSDNETDTIVPRFDPTQMIQRSSQNDDDIIQWVKYLETTEGNDIGDGDVAENETWMQIIKTQVEADVSGIQGTATARTSTLERDTARLTARLASSMSSAKLREQVQQLLASGASRPASHYMSIAAVVQEEKAPDAKKVVAEVSAAGMSSTALSRVWLASSGLLRYLILGSSSMSNDMKLHRSVIGQHAVELCGAISAGGVYSQDAKDSMTTQDAAQTRLLRRLDGVDKDNSRDTVKIGVLYVARGQHTQAAVLGNELPASIIGNGSVDREVFKSFVRSLGWGVNLATHQGFLGGLERNDTVSNGGLAWYFASPVMELMYHVVTEFPTLNGASAEAAAVTAGTNSVSGDQAKEGSSSGSLRSAPQHINKKRHVGNDAVHICFSNNHGSCICCSEETGPLMCGDYQPSMIKSQFNDAHVVIYPLGGPYGYQLARVQIFQKQQLNRGLDSPASLLHHTIGSPLFGPLLDGMVIPMGPTVLRCGPSGIQQQGTVAALLARLTAVQAHFDTKKADERQQFEAGFARRMRTLRSFVDSSDPVNMVAKEGISVAGATAAALGGRHRTSTIMSNDASEQEASADRSAVLRTLLI